MQKFQFPVAFYLAEFLLRFQQSRGRPAQGVVPGPPAFYIAGHFFHDITWGNNAFNLNAYLPASSTNIPGYVATPGWDLASGWGTPDLSTLLWELCRQ